MAESRFDRPVHTKSDIDTEINTEDPERIQSEILAVDAEIKRLQERKAQLLIDLGKTGHLASTLTPTISPKQSTHYARRKGTW